MTDIFSQTDSLTQVANIHIRLIDAQTLEACPYVRIFNKQQQTGVLSDIHGMVVLNAYLTEDSLRISTPGYLTIENTVSELIQDSIIFLQPIENSIDEVYILARDQFLYRWLSSVFQTGKLPEITAKSYLEVQSSLNDNPVELVESYYNASLKGFKIENLALKNGRIALAKEENQSFVSTDISRAILQLNLNAENDFLPDLPFHYRSKKMRKYFGLQLNQILLEDNKHPVYIIDFKPKTSNNTAFSGKIWFDTVLKRAQKLVLNCHNTSVFPFVPISNRDRISNASVTLTIIFKEDQQLALIDFIYFDYSFTYVKYNDSAFQIASHVILHLYDLNNGFLLPNFDFPLTGTAVDYRRIIAVPYNTDFWQSVSHPISHELQQENDDFFAQNSLLFRSDSTEIPFDTYGRTYFEAPFQQWKTRRFVLVNTLKDSIKNSPRYVQPTSQLYELKAQVYLDINPIGDQYDVISTTLLDPYHTFYHLEMDSTTNCFVNMYLDLVEIERRKFMQKIAADLQDLSAIETAYDELTLAIDQQTARFLKEVDHGTNLEQLKKWNVFIRKELGIDNFAVFKLQE